MDASTFAANLASVRQRIEQACGQANRSPDTVRLVAVTKTYPVDVMRMAIKAGLSDIGENRVQEAVPKIQQVPRATFHLIGHLQSNKARQAVEFFDFIHSVDSLHLAQEIDRHAARLSKMCKVLLQVNISGEDTKSGIEPGAVRSVAADIVRLCPAVHVAGLMTMAPFVAEPEETRPVFRGLRGVAEDLRRDVEIGPELSMGMTNDYEVAIEEGATMVRIGSALFGSREV